MISNNLINNVSKCDISVSPLTDHCAVLLSFSFHKSGCERSVIWKFNNSLLENEGFCEKVKEALKDVNAMETSPLSKWEWFKFNVRGLAIEIGKQISKFKSMKWLELINELHKFGNKTDLTIDEQIQQNNIQAKFDNLYLEKAQGAFICSRARWIEEGEKNSSYFFNLEKQRQTKEKIQKLSINGIFIEDDDQINEEIRIFGYTLF